MNRTIDTISAPLHAFFVIAVAIWISIAQPATAANFVHRSTQELKQSTFVDPKSACHFELSGAINEGDAEEFLQFFGDIATEGQTKVLCLNSPGGSLGQAVKIAEMIMLFKVATMIEKDAKCLSSCAFVFMAGSARDLTFAAEQKAFIWRVLQPGGTLGIHRPDLPLKGKNLTINLMQKVYGVALQTVSRVIELLATEGFLSEGVHVKQSFLLSWLATPFEDMRYIRTIDDAGRWQIALNAMSFSPELTDEILTLGCRNALAWQKDTSAITAMARDQYAIASEQTVDKYGRPTFKVWANPALGEGCTFYGTSGSKVETASQFSWVELNVSGGKSGLEVFPFFFADPRMMIKDFE